MKILQFNKVCKRFGSVEVVKNVDLKINHGEFVVFVGPSGCGKSTILRMIAGLEDISNGQLLLDGVVINDAPPVERGIAMVFQSYALYPNMTVRKNLSFGLEQTRVSKSKIKERVDKVAEVLKITPLLDRRPSQLSGGQSQRVAIGRAIVRKPKIFLFDEPLSNLDAELRVHMRIELTKLHSDLQKTMIYVTHDQTEAMTLADRIVVLNNGRIEQTGTPLELYNTPENLFVAGFIGSPKMNFLHTDYRMARTKNASKVSLKGTGFTCEVNKLFDTVIPEKGKIILGMRPEHLKVVKPNQGILNVKVHLVEHMGGEVFFYGDIPGSKSTLIIKTPGQKNLKIGSLIGVDIDIQKIYFFDPLTSKLIR